MPWQELLNSDPMEWLLEEVNPSVRYFTLRWLLDRADGDGDVAAARQAIAESAPVRKLLKRQRPPGYWGSKSHSHYSRGELTLLAWLGAPPEPAICRAVEYRMDQCLQENGGYGLWYNDQWEYIPCHGAELLRQMIWFGYAADPRSRKLLDWLLSIQEPDGAWKCVFRAKPFPCMWASADVLRLFGSLPADWLSPEVKDAQRRVVELFLNSRLCHYGKGKPDPRWSQFGFPLQHDSDILEVLEQVAPFVDPDDPRIQPGLQLVLQKQDSQGRWPCEKEPKGGNKWYKAYLSLDEVGNPSKWVTLHAMRMLKTLYRQPKEKE